MGNQLNFLDIKIIESPILEDVVPEYYRGYGGYNARWLIRKVRYIKKPKAMIFSAYHGLLFCPPSHIAILRNIMP
jgi:hypothetical protein